MKNLMKIFIVSLTIASCSSSGQNDKAFDEECECELIKKEKCGLQLCLYTVKVKRGDSTVDTVTFKHSSCNDGSAMGTCSTMCPKKNESCNDSDLTLETSAINDPDKCPPLRYSEEFQAVYVETTSCGSLNDVDFVYNYANGICDSRTKQMVDMSKYIRLAVEEECSDGSKIYTYQRKE